MLRQTPDSRKTRIYKKEHFGSYNRGINFTPLSADAKIKKIRVWCNSADENKQTIDLEFNSNASLKEFFLSCPKEWHDLERWAELGGGSDLAPQISLDKDPSTLKHAHFGIKKPGRSV